MKMHVFICTVLCTHGSQMQITECKHTLEENRQQINTCSRPKPKSCKTFDIKHRFKRFSVKYEEKRTVRKLVKIWWKKNKKSLKMHGSSAKFDRFVKVYRKLSERFRYLFILRQIYPFRYDYKKIQLCYKKSPFLFAVYWSMTQHKYLENFLLECVYNNEISPKFEKIKAAFDILDNLDEDDRCDQESTFQAINASLKQMLLEPRATKTMRKKSKEGPLPIPVDNLFYDNKAPGISTDIIDFKQIKNLQVNFKAATGLALTEVTNVDDCILKAEDMQETAMLVFLGLNGLIVPDDYVIVEVGLIAGIVNDVLKTNIKVWTFDTKKLTRDLKSFRKYIDSWLEHLSQLKLINQLITKFECRKLYNLDGITEVNYTDRIKHVNTANRYLVYMVLKIIDHVQKQGTVKTGGYSSLGAQNMATKRADFLEAKSSCLE